jgi:hypothetical protein
MYSVNVYSPSGQWDAHYRAATHAKALALVGTIRVKHPDIVAWINDELV